MTETDSTAVIPLDQLISHYLHKNAYHAERALKLSKFPGAQEKRIEHLVAAKVYGELASDGIKTVMGQLKPTAKRSGLIERFTALFKPGA